MTTHIVRQTLQRLPPSARTCGCTSPGCRPTADGDVPVIVRGEGAYVYDDKGKRYLDGLAGLFVVAGRSRPHRAGRGGRRAGRASSRTSRCGPTRTRRRSSWPSGSPSSRPATSNRVFFTTGGGEAVESAWKLARQYFKRDRPAAPLQGASAATSPTTARTMGALSITGIPAIKDAVRAAACRARIRVPNTNFYRAPEHGDDVEAFGAGPPTRSSGRSRCEGPETVAAVFLEPVQNSGGCFPPPPGYFQRVREICDRHGVLLVSDEVICAFGRLGDWFGSRALRLPARHHHLRQGHDVGLLPARRR